MGTSNDFDSRPLPHPVRFLYRACLVVVLGTIALGAVLAVTAKTLSALGATLAFCSVCCLPAVGALWWYSRWLDREFFGALLHPGKLQSLIAGLRFATVPHIHEQLLVLTEAVGKDVMMERSVRRLLLGRKPRTPIVVPAPTPTRVGFVSRKKLPKLRSDHLPGKQLSTSTAGPAPKTVDSDMPS